MIRGRKKIEYHYDKQENLAWAVDHELRKRLDLSYDLNGRITILKEKDVKSSKDLRTVYFNYDQGGRPNIIKEKLPQGDEGSIQISYGKQGEVLSVLNGQGRRLASGSDGDRASRIYDTFQYLLDIVEPSGLNLEAGGG